MPKQIIVVGGGAFGVAAGIELRRRGHSVTLVDPGPLPSPLASSTDISKFIRFDYGGDDLLTELALDALEIWDEWNARWAWPPYRETGLLVLSERAMERGSFEGDSYERVERLGLARRLGPESLASSYPAWKRGRYVDGYFNRRAGWAPSGRVVEEMLARARDLGLSILENVRVSGLLERGTTVAGIETEGGDRLAADCVIVAAGAWTPTLLPAMSDRMWAVGQPVFHLRPSDPSAFRPPAFPCWTADIARTGWYGFPANDDGLLKIANHGPGRRVHPDQPREVLEENVEHLRAFLGEALPALANAPIAATRLCLYCDSWDGDFYIARDPARPNLVVAAGDSGHGFKFTPVIGSVVADVVEERPNRFAERFAWREPGARTAEDARFLGTEPRG